MQITPFIIYLWGVVDSISAAACAITMMASIGGIMALAFSYAEELPQIRKPAILGLCVAFLAMLVAVFTPTSKTLALMVVVPAILNSEPVQKDLPDLYNIAVEALKENLTEKE